MNTLSLESNIEFENQFIYAIAMVRIHSFHSGLLFQI